VDAIGKSVCAGFNAPIKQLGLDRSLLLKWRSAVVAELADAPALGAGG
jgi:hypothetical protein